MSGQNITNFNPELDLKIERVIDLSPEQLFKAYTTPELLMKWFCPKPWNVTECEMDLRPGGTFYTKMESPTGETSPMYGCFLEIIPNKKVSWTDTMISDFRPSEKSFLTAIMTFEEHDGKTVYTAIAKHKNAADKKSHEDMGFEVGWNTALDQLVLLMKSL